MGIREVAHRANVSIATVSRVINGTKAVSEAVEKRVREAIDIEGYTPNHAAKTMVKKLTGTVGIMVPKLSYSFHQTMLRGVESVLSEAENNLIVVSVSDQEPDELQYVKLLAENKVDGLIIAHEILHESVVSHLKRLQTPVVLASVTIPHIDRPRITIDDYAAAYDGTYYLLTSGHARVALIADLSSHTGRLREEGYSHAHRVNGYHIDSTLIINSYFSMQGGYDAVKSLLASKKQIDAIFCTSDEMGIGALKCLQDAQVKVPDEISVLGMDGIELGKFTIPALTSVVQPIQEIGVIATQKLLRLIGEKRTISEDTLLSHKIVERGSVRSR